MRPASQAHRRALIVALVCAATYLADAANFGSYASWSSSCSGVPVDCDSAVAATLDFLYTATYGRTPTVASQSALATACQQCGQRLEEQLGARLPAGNAATCPLFPDKPLLNTSAAAMRQYACFGASPGDCVIGVSRALNTAGVLQRVREFNPTLRFRGALLSSVCGALVPPSGATCCGRTWAYLMAGLAQQMCMTDLSLEYVSLLGRCELLLNATAPGFCQPGWDLAMLPLLAPPADGRCAALAPPTGVPSDPSNPVLPWLHGAACSAGQTNRSACAASPCDLWCGLVGASTEPYPPSPPPPPSLPPLPPPAAPPGGDGGDDDDLNVATIVIICVFGVLILGLLVLLCLFFWASYQDRREADREAYAFNFAGEGGGGGDPYVVSKSAPVPTPVMAGAAARSAPAAHGSTGGYAGSVRSVSTPLGPPTSSAPPSPHSSLPKAAGANPMPSAFAVPAAYMWRAGSAAAAEASPRVSLSQPPGAATTTPRYVPGAGAAGAAGAPAAAAAAAGGAGAAATAEAVATISRTPIASGGGAPPEAAAGARSAGPAAPAPAPAAAAASGGAAAGAGAAAGVAAGVTAAGAVAEAAGGVGPSAGPLQDSGAAMLTEERLSAAAVAMQKITSHRLSYSESSDKTFYSAAEPGLSRDSAGSYMTARSATATASIYGPGSAGASGRLTNVGSAGALASAAGSEGGGAHHRRAGSDVPSPLPTVKEQ